MHINFDKDPRGRDVIKVEAIADHEMKARGWMGALGVSSKVVYLSGPLVVARAAKITALGEIDDQIDNIAETFKDQPHDIRVNPLVMVTFVHKDDFERSINLNPYNDRRGKVVPPPIRLREEYVEPYAQLPEPTFVNEGHPLTP